MAIGKFIIINMITLLFIALIVWVIYAYNKKDERSSDADERIQELPAILYHSKEQDSGKRFFTGELFESNKNVLLDFNYNNGFLTLTMKSGNKVSGLLNQMSVRFEKLMGETYITVKANNNKVKIIKLGNFTDAQWENMIGVFLLAGTTYGSEIFSSMYKNLSRANIILKIISKL